MASVSQAAGRTVAVRAPLARPAVGSPETSFYTVLALTAVFVLYGVVALELTPLPAKPLPEDVFSEKQADRFASLIRVPGGRVDGSQHWWSDMPVPERTHTLPRVGSIVALAGVPRGQVARKFSLRERPRQPRNARVIAALSNIEGGGVLALLGSSGEGFGVSGTLGGLDGGFVSTIDGVEGGLGFAGVVGAVVSEPVPRLGWVRVVHGPPSAVVRRALVAQLSESEACSASSPARAQVRMHAEADGRVVAVRVRGVDEELRACLQTELESWSLPPKPTEVRFLVLW